MAAAPRTSKPAEPETPDAPADDPAAREVQHATDKAQQRGFYGVETDPTPNEHYTVAGVIQGRPTPETDPEAAEAARRAARGR
ncbi:MULTISPECIES: hypothetical protein [Streptomyces]|uniref:Uncharacterized protein n=2 Tax=Streptomyces rimosus subsp. rimosus TaxID=132474 RepID=L8EV28_STRR1|nr:MULTISPECIES: hypothetical protein [Streptomyces]KOG84149.1 hypothetical protein ADK78_00685 [Kitasatospora aureofaciens]MYT44942.1 hypothetical protein [Streptomyces sp. SID5471]KUJ43431.1 hypothetical protein ADK46_00670 [Streptomyces rimosus subsp. rimosus]QDA07192.1 hypothetical protein CTZ40_29030 [Streptomyces rimosus]QGY70424.1 hypothetical protein V519_035170 [Streptomyces rimosus R6-500]